MKPILVIFNGIRFPYYLFEYALKKAKEEKTGLHALYLTNEEGTDQGYVFPNDLSLTEEAISDAEDEEKSNQKLILEQMKVARDMAEKESVIFDTERRNNASLEEILALAKNYSMIYIDASRNDEAPLLANTNFNTEDLIAQSPVPVEQVSESKALR